LLTPLEGPLARDPEKSLGTRQGRTGLSGR
jgi:hypothetical protein